MRSSPLSVPLDAAHRSALPRESVVATVEGNDVRCEGVALAALLRAAGALPAGKLEGEALARYVLVAGREGTRVLFSLAELSQEQDQRSVVLADRCGGVALDDRDGPLLLVAPGQTPSLRGVRQVQSITVVAAP